MRDLQTSAILNPFIVGGSISAPGGEGFFGREDIFAFVRSALNATQPPPILLFGQRRIGKSSILRQLPNHLRSDLVSVYYDLQGKATMPLDGVLYGLARAISESLGLAYPARNEATEDTFTQIFLPRVISQLKDTRRLVLLLDEFDVIDEAITTPAVAAKRFIPYLGYLVSEHRQVGLIMVIGRKTEELSESFNSALLKDSVQRRIGRLEREKVVRLIHEMSSPTLTFSDAAAERTYELAAGHPFCTQVLCHTVWNNHEDWNQPIIPSEIDGAVPAAIEFGTNGMNWIYDGLITPEQRLSLSALSETVDPLAGKRASLSVIQKYLRDNRLSVGSAELDRARRELSSWDVVEGNPTEGIRFVVPLLGAWVRKERPIAQLDKEPRFVNPRAWAFYEVAVDSQQRGKLDDAIEDYRNALKFNPVFLDAQRSLASSLQKRNKPEDVDATIEAWERVLELDPEGPRSDLLDALMLALELAESPAVISSRFHRIAELDNGGRWHERALRNVRDHASAKIAIGSRSAIVAAAELYNLLEDDKGKTYANEIRRKQERVTTISSGSFLIFVLSAVGLGLSPWGDRAAYAVILFAALAGTVLSLPLVMEKEPELTLWLTLRRAGLPFLASGLVIGGLIWGYFQTLLGASFAAYFISLMNAVNSPEFPQDKTVSSATAQGTNPIVAFLDVSISLLLKLRSRLNKSAQHERE